MGAHVHGVSEVPGQLGVYLVDLGQGIPNAGADGLAGALGGIAETAGTSAQSGGGGELVDQCCALGAEGLDVGGAAVLGLIDLGVEGAEPGLVLLLRRVVEHRISTCAGRLRRRAG